MPVGSTGNHPKRFVSLFFQIKCLPGYGKKHHLYVDHLNHLFVGKCMDFDTYLNLPKGDPSKLQVVLRHFFEDHEPWINIKPIIDQLSGRTHPIHWQTCRYGHPPLRKQHHYLAKNYMLIQKSGQDKCVFHVLKFAGWLKSLISCDIFSYRFLFVCFKDPSLFSLATSIFPWFCCFLLPRFAWISNQVTIQHTKHC